MAPPKLSWAAVARSNVPNPSQNVTPVSTLPTTASAPHPPSEPQRPKVAFISGHIDLTLAQFSANYSSALDAAIHRGDAFVLSNAGGADTLALSYLRAHNVDPSRITVYMHTSRPNRKLNVTQMRVDKMRLGPEVEEKYRKEGYNMKVVQGYHNERDAAMTDASDYDILWVRGEAETAALYGEKYRPGRISGTQKNRDRRLLKSRRTASPSVT